MLVTVRAPGHLPLRGLAPRWVRLYGGMCTTASELARRVQDFLERGDLYQALADDKERRFSWHRRCVSPAAHPACGALDHRCGAGGGPRERSCWALRSCVRRKSRTGQFVPNTGMARKVALDIARGLQYLHSRSPKVVHFDVKVPIPITARL